MGAVALEKVYLSNMFDTFPPALLSATVPKGLRILDLSFKAAQGVQQLCAASDFRLGPQPDREIV
jgi:hypothetical protein